MINDIKIKKKSLNFSKFGKDEEDDISLINIIFDVVW